MHPSVRPAARKNSRSTLALAGASSLLLAQTLPAQTADQLVRQGRAELGKRTSKGLSQADALFTKALTKNPDHAAANVLKTGTSFALANSRKPTITAIGLIGAQTIDPNPFDLDTIGSNYKWAVDEKERFVPGKTASTKVVRDWARTFATPLVDAALQRLAKVRDRKFLLALSRQESDYGDLLVDYGDVHYARFLLLVGKAISALQETYNTDASFHVIYEMIRRGELDLETFLERYPFFLTRVGPDQRGLSKNYFLAAVRAYRMASPVLRARGSEEEWAHLITLENEIDFRNGLEALAKSFTSTQKIEGVSYNLGQAITSSRTPRSLLGRRRGNAFVPGTWPDPTLGGILVGANQSFIQRQANVVTQALNASYPDPTIISPGRVSGKVGRSFAYQIKSDLKARSFAARPLPPGLKLTKSGLITGKPTTAGNYSVKVTANTNAGPASRIVTISVGR